MAQRVTGTGNSIWFDHVTVTAATPDGRVRILSDIDLELTDHRVALIGPNASGKSTLAKLVNGLVEPSAGRVEVNGHDVADDGRAVRRQVAFAFTDPAAQLVMPTVIEDIELSLRADVKDRQARTRAARTVLDDFGLADLAERSVHTLSGGQRQLVALAGVLATSPRILVADEPTTLLDLRNATIVADMLLQLDQQLLLATHDLELAQRCDRALLIDHGQVVADGEPGEVVARYRADVQSPRAPGRPDPGTRP